AAGMSIPAADLAAFRDAWTAAVTRVVATIGGSGVGGGLQPGVNVVWTDGGLDGPDLQLAMAEILADHGPWGQGFPEPLFENRFLMREQRAVGEKRLKVNVQLDAGGPVLDGIAFNRTPLAGGSPQLARLVYRLDINDYRGTRSAQLVVEYLESV